MRDLDLAFPPRPSETPHHDRPQDRHPAVEPGGDLAGDARCGEAGRSTGLRPSLDLGPHLRDLRRPVPADLRGLDVARGVGDGHRPDPAGPARRGEHVPQSGPHGQDGRDPRPHQRRPRDPRHRRRLVRAGAHGPRHRVRDRVRPAARLARRGGRRDARRARRRIGDLGARRPLRVRRPAAPAPADPEAPADHDRRQRREEDAAHRREVRRHVERAWEPWSS